VSCCRWLSLDYAIICRLAHIYVSSLAVWLLLVIMSTNFVAIVSGCCSSLDDCSCETCISLSLCFPCQGRLILAKSITVRFYKFNVETFAFSSLHVDKTQVFTAEEA
jgi:hypothetical protein